MVEVNNGEIAFVPVSMTTATHVIKNSFELPMFLLIFDKTNLVRKECGFLFVPDYRISNNSNDSSIKHVVCLSSTLFFLL